jgi:hypothetical protein
MIPLLVLGLTNIAIIVVFVRMDDDRTKSFEKERSEWKQERQMLLDRIQAPTFAEYTSKVVKEIKAAKPEEEKDKQEYIS